MTDPAPDNRAPRRVGLAALLAGIAGTMLVAFHQVAGWLDLLAGGLVALLAWRLAVRAERGGWPRGQWRVAVAVVVPVLCIAATATLMMAGRPAPGLTYSPLAAMAELPGSPAYGDLSVHGPLILSLVAAILLLSAVPRRPRMPFAAARAGTRPLPPTADTVSGARCLAEWVRRRVLALPVLVATPLLLAALATVGMAEVRWRFEVSRVAHDGRMQARADLEACKAVLPVPGGGFPPPPFEEPEVDATTGLPIRHVHLCGCVITDEILRRATIDATRWNAYRQEVTAWIDRHGLPSNSLLDRFLAEEAIIAAARSAALMAVGTHALPGHAGTVRVSRKYQHHTLAINAHPIRELMLDPAVRISLLPDGYVVVVMAHGSGKQQAVVYDVPTRLRLQTLLLPSGPGAPTAPAD